MLFRSLHVALLFYVVKALSAIHLSMDKTPALIVVYLVIAQATSILVLQRIEKPARNFIRARFATARPQNRIMSA